MLLGSKCDSDAECQADVTINSRCFAERCSCRPYHAAFNGTTCLESTLLGFDCLMDEQCSLKTANSVCIEGSCGCGVGFLQFRRHTCLKPAKPGEVCYSNAHCLLWDSDSHCEFMIRNLLGRCMCNSAQKQRGNTCLPGNVRPMVEEPSTVHSEPEHKKPVVLPEVTVSSHVITHVYSPSTTTHLASEYYTTSTKPFYDNSLPEAPPVGIPEVVLVSNEPVEEEAVVISHKPQPSEDMFVSQLAGDGETPTEKSSDALATTEHMRTEYVSTEKPPTHNPTENNYSSAHSEYDPDAIGTEKMSFTDDILTSQTSSEGAMTVQDATSEVPSMGGDVQESIVTAAVDVTSEASSMAADVQESTVTSVDVTSEAPSMAADVQESTMTSSADLMSSESSHEFFAMAPHTTTATRTRLEDSSVAVSLGLSCDTDLQCLRADPASRCVDGVCDCAARGNGSDACGARNRGTHAYTFQCRSTGNTISWFFVCDGRQDCADGSDEECQEKGGVDCPTGSFRCGDGHCVSTAAVCDGVVDCASGRDEARCKDVRCPANTFRCADGACLPEYEFCNAVVSCSDGSDEPRDACKKRSKRGTQYCPFRCSNGRCRSTAIVCSGKDGCGDGSDEARCSVCKCPAIN